MWFKTKLPIGWHGSGRVGLTSSDPFNKVFSMIFYSDFVVCSIDLTMHIIVSYKKNQENNFMVKKLNNDLTQTGLTLYINPYKY